MTVDGVYDEIEFVSSREMVEGREDTVKYGRGGRFCGEIAGIVFRRFGIDGWILPVSAVDSTISGLEGKMRVSSFGVADEGRGSVNAFDRCLESSNEAANALTGR